MADESVDSVEETADRVKRPGAASGSATTRRAKRKSTVGAKERAGATSKKATRSEAADSPTAKNATAVEGGEAEDELTPVSRKELLEKALRAVETDLDAEGGQRPTNTIGNLVQLLKLDRSFREDEEQPHEIRVVWEEKRDETLDDLPERKSEALPKA